MGARIDPGRVVNRNVTNCDAVHVGKTNRSYKIRFKERKVPIQI